MKLVALIHTVPTVYATFADRVIADVPKIRITNTVDEFLASDPAEKGCFTKSNARRLFWIVEAAAATGADAIVTTCSTLSPIVEIIRPLIEPPILTIDGSMLCEAVKIGRRIAVVATADSTIGPTTATLRQEAIAAEKEVEIGHILCREAYTAIKARDQKTHDRMVLERLAEVKAEDYDVFVLAQASMAHLEVHATEMTGRPVLSSPDRCIAELRRCLQLE